MQYLQQEAATAAYCCLFWMYISMKAAATRTRNAEEYEVKGLCFEHIDKDACQTGERKINARSQPIAAFQKRDRVIARPDPFVHADPLNRLGNAGSQAKTCCLLPRESDTIPMRRVLLLASTLSFFKFDPQEQMAVSRS